MDKLEGEISLIELKKYIAYAKMKCFPKLSVEAALSLQNFYVKDRKQILETKYASMKKKSIPVTVRQLEAIIRMSEAIAKMSLSTTVLESHVTEAHRLFQVSTLSTASAGYNMTTDIPHDLIPYVRRIEESIKRRYPIRHKISYSKLIEELSNMFSNSKAIEHAIVNLVKVGDFQFMDSRKVVMRVN